MVATFIGLLLPILAPRKNHALGRRLFWSGLTLSTFSAFFIAYPSDWKSGAGLSLFVAAMMLMTAYFTSPYLKFGGKTFAVFTVDAEADEPAREDEGGHRFRSRRGGAAADGVLTSARKLWWLMVPAITLCAFNIGHYVTARENPRLAAAMAIVVVVVSVAFGFVDARTGLPIARGQRPQFVVVSIVTVGVFAVLYLSAYGAGKQSHRRDGPRVS